MKVFDIYGVLANQTKEEIWSNAAEVIGKRNEEIKTLKHRAEVAEMKLKEAKECANAHALAAEENFRIAEIADKALEICVKEYLFRGQKQVPSFYEEQINTLKMFATAEIEKEKK